jgi:hypothetical protein
LTYQSEKSGAVNYDANDHITFFEELPAELVNNPKTGTGNSQSTKFKEQLTSQRVSANVLEYGDDGIRRTIEYVSQRIGCFIGMTNMAKHAVDPASLTRFHSKQYLIHNRPKHNIVDLSSLDKQQTSTSNTRRNEFK